MTDAFTKLFSSIITSSIWSEDDKIRLMWITMLATADSTGFVAGSIPGMAAIARMSLQDAEKSIAALCAPDPYSRSKDYGGCRLMEIDGGWMILNYLKYRQKRDPERRREQNRKAQERFRRKHKVSQSKPKSAEVSLSREEKADIERKGALTEFFDSFWREYPKKVGKGAARKAFERLKPPRALFEKMLLAIEQQKQSEQWKVQGGRFIPYPATWLNHERWSDEVEYKETIAEQMSRLEKEGVL
jgi:hypothetical protein